VSKIAEKAVCRGVFFDNMVLYFMCRINKNALLQTEKRTPSDCFFGDFAYWERLKKKKFTMSLFFSVLARQNILPREEPYDVR